MIYPRGCEGGCELGLDLCEGQWTPQLCVLQRREPTVWGPLIRERAAAGLKRPEGFIQNAEPEFPVAILQAAEACEWRKLESQAGCCGPAYHCRGGYHDGARVDYLRFCAACVSSHATA